MKNYKVSVVVNAIDRLTAPMRRVTRGNAAATEQLKRLKARSAELTAQSKLVPHFKRVKIATVATKDKLAAAQQQVKNVARQIKLATTPPKELVASLEKMQARSHQLAVRMKQQQRVVGQARSAYARLNAELRKKQKAGVKSEDLVTLRKRIADANRVLKEHREKLSRVTRGQKEAGNAVDDLKRKITAAVRPSKRLNQEFEASKRKARSLKMAYGRQREELERLRRKMSAAGLSSRNLAADQIKLRQNLKKTNDEIARFKQPSPEQGGGVSGVGAAAGAYGVGREIKKSWDLETELRDLMNIANLTEEQMFQIEERLMALSKRQVTNQSAVDLLRGLKSMAQDVNFEAYNIDIMDAADSTRAIGRAATGSRAQVEDLSKASVAYMTHLGGSPKDLARFFDMVAQAGKEGSFELKDMAKHFPSLAPHLKAMKLQGDEAVATLAALAQVAKLGTGSTDSAATNLENFLTKMSSSETRRKFEKMLTPAKMREYKLDRYVKFKKGKETFDLEKYIKDAQAKNKNSVEAMIDLLATITKGDNFRIGELFEDMQVQAFLRPLIQNLERYKEIKKKSLSARGVVDKDFQNNLETSNEALKGLSNEWTNLTNRLTKGIKPTLDLGLKAITLPLKGINWLLEKVPGAASIAAHGLALGFGVYAAKSVTGLAAKIGALTGLTKGKGKAKGSSFLSRMKTRMQTVKTRFVNRFPKATGYLKNLRGGLTKTISAMKTRFSALGTYARGLWARLPGSGNLVARGLAGLRLIGAGILRLLGPLSLVAQAVYMWVDRWEAIKNGIYLVKLEIGDIFRKVKEEIAGLAKMSFTDITRKIRDNLKARLKGLKTEATTRIVHQLKTPPVKKETPLDRRVMEQKQKSQAVIKLSQKRNRDRLDVVIKDESTVNIVPTPEGMAQGQRQVETLFHQRGQDVLRALRNAGYDENQY